MGLQASESKKGDQFLSQTIHKKGCIRYFHVNITFRRVQGRKSCILGLIWPRSPYNKTQQGYIGPRAGSQIWLIRVESWEVMGRAKGRIPLPNPMIFWKNSKWPMTPFPSFLEDYIAFFLNWIWLHLCKEAQDRQYQKISVNIS